MPPPSIHLPIGISFSPSWECLSDRHLSRSTQSATQSLNFALYIALFPHLIAGPIVHYSEIAKEIVARHTSRSEFAEGVGRFINPDSAKMIIMYRGPYGDNIFSIPGYHLTFGVSPTGQNHLLCPPSISISPGYSDMAIGCSPDVWRLSLS